MRPTPIPQKPLISSERTQLVTCQPPPIGAPFSAATTNSPTSAAITPSTRPSSQ